MRKSLWIILSVLVVAVGARIAHADSFTATFTCNVPCISTPTAPNVTFPSPRTIMETWNGFTQTLTLPPVDLPTDHYSWANTNFISFPPPTFVTKFDITDITRGISTLMVTTGSTPIPLVSDSGTLNFATVSTPEPGSAGLMLLGVGLVLLLRKRNSRGHQLAT